LFPDGGKRASTVSNKKTDDRYQIPPGRLGPEKKSKGNQDASKKGRDECVRDRGEGGKICSQKITRPVLNRRKRYGIGEGIVFLSGR